jgi:hypothetical protein
MAHRPASRANPPKADVRRPEAKQVRASDNTPCAVSVIGGVAGMQLNENFAHGFQSDNYDSEPSQPHWSRQAKTLNISGGVPCGSRMPFSTSLPRSGLVQDYFCDAFTTVRGAACAVTSTGAINDQADNTVAPAHDRRHELPRIVRRSTLTPSRTAAPSIITHPTSSESSTCGGTGSTLWRVGIVTLTRSGGRG